MPNELLPGGIRVHVGPDDIRHRPHVHVSGPKGRSGTVSFDGRKLSGNLNSSDLRTVNAWLKANRKRIYAMYRRFNHV